MTTRMVERAGQSLPKQCDDWAELKAAYRLLSNPQVRPEALGEPHQRRTFESCIGQPIVLAVQDDTHLGKRCGRELHTTLAVLPGGQLLGVLDQRFFDRVKQPAGETRKEREARWRESLVWCEAVQSIGAAPPGCRLLHVADRASDDFDFFDACDAMEVGFLIRARHDRHVEEKTDKLWSYLEKQPLAGRRTVRIGEQRDVQGRITRRGREVSVDVRWVSVRLEAPQNHPGAHQSRQVQAIYLYEPDAPAEVEPVEWLLLTSESIGDWEDVSRLTDFYCRRWVIEEWHRALKEGCRLEASQLDTPEDHCRLAAILSVIAVRLLQLRDLADPQHPSADDPEALRRWAPQGWIRVVAHVCGEPRDRLTPRQFFLAIAKKGGYLARKNDPRPGWKVLWRGWYDIALLVQGALLAPVLEHEY
jgi:Transposase DNA-binding/Transposase DDE domain